MRGGPNRGARSLPTWCVCVCRLNVCTLRQSFLLECSLKRSAHRTRTSAAIPTTSAADVTPWLIVQFAYRCKVQIGGGMILGRAGTIFRYRGAQRQCETPRCRPDLTIPTGPGGPPGGPVGGAGRGWRDGASPRVRTDPCGTLASRPCVLPSLSRVPALALLWIGQTPCIRTRRTQRRPTKRRPQGWQRPGSRT